MTFGAKDPHDSKNPGGGRTRLTLQETKLHTAM